MNLHELLTDEALRQREFPVAKSRIYLAHAGVCPLPRRVAGAIADYAEKSQTEDPETCLPPGFLAQTRGLAARLLHAEPSEIAFVGPTSQALSTIAAGLTFPRRGNILVYFDDYPSNVYPWLALASRELEVRLLNTRELGRIRPPEVLGQVDEDTLLVAFASCHFLTGYRLEIEALGRALRERHILFSVDAIQTLGAFPTTVEQVDFLAADAHKWLLGPTAAGILYVRQSVQDQLRPSALGWHNVLCPDFVAQEEIELRDDARRYEAGSHNLLGLVGLRASLELLAEIGIEAIGSEIARKRDGLAAALREEGFQVLNPAPGPRNTSGIVSFSHAKVPAQALYEHLAAGGVTASLRADRKGRKYIRFSPHFYNTDAELGLAIELLRRAVAAAAPAEAGSASSG